MIYVSFFVGFLAGVMCTLWVRKYIYDKFAPRSYVVADFSRTVNQTGVYEMKFYLTPDVVLEGYTKKIPPLGVKPENLLVKIRTFNIRRG